MKKSVSDLLNSLIQTVAFYDEKIAGNESYSEFANSIDYVQRLERINNLYTALSEQDKEEFYRVLDDEFRSDIPLYIFLLSFMIKAVNSNGIIEKLIEIICKGQLDVYTSVELELQILAEINKNYEQGSMYDKQRKLHTYNSESFRAIIQPPSDYIPYQKRNKNRVVVMAEQLLALKHAPSKITYNLCYTLQQVLGMEVLLISCPIVTKQIKTNNCWTEVAITEYYYQELNGNYVFFITGDNVLSKEYELNGYFVINYKDCNIAGRQVPFCSENTDNLRNLIQIIYEFNPAFIYNLDMVSPVAEICAGFTTLVSGAMNYGYPVSNAHILLKLAKRDEAKSSTEDIAILNPYRQLVIRDELHFDIEPPVNYENRSMYGIAEDAFLIVMIGNRLEFDLTLNFKSVLKSMFELDQKIEILLIGKYPEYQQYFSDEIFADRIHNIEYHNHLTEVLGIADLYLNPPRTGGGTSALISLYSGVPVITLPEGDVAGNVGGDFICADEQDMINTVRRYLTDKDFYKQQQQKGLAITNKLTDDTTKLKDKLSKITQAIIISEEGGLSEN
jgi:hypothetical protein